MTREERNKLLDKLEQLRFFNQRAGRELWADKSQELQDKDIKNTDAILEMAISALSENKGEWIPVSERLPEKNMPCLVAVGQFNLTQMAIYSDLMRTIDHKIFYQGDYGHEDFRDITEYVKAWQPLPEPYKAESEEE